MARKAKITSSYSFYNKFWEGFNPSVLDNPTEAISEYKKMSNDSVINGVLDAIRIAIHEATYEIQAPDNPSPKEKKIVAILNSLLFEKFNFKRFLKSATFKEIFGFQIFEKEFGDTSVSYKYKYSDKEGEEKERTETKPYVGLIGLYALPPESIVEEDGARDRRGDLLFLTQEIDNERIRLSRSELLIVNTKSFSDADWRGTSPLRAVYDDWWMKEKFWLTQGNTIEKFGPGIDYIKILARKQGTSGGEFGDEDNIPSLPNEEYEKIEEETQEVLNNVTEGKTNNIVYGADFEYGVVERLGNFPDILSAIRECKDNIVTSLIAPQLKLGGSGASGSYALGVNYSALFLKAVEGRANEILDIFNEEIVKELIDLNFGSQQRYPKVVVNNIAKSYSKDMFMILQNLPALQKSAKVLQLGAAEIGVPLESSEAEELVKLEQKNTQPIRRREEAQNQSKQEPEEEN